MRTLEQSYSPYIESYGLAIRNVDCSLHRPLESRSHADKTESVAVRQLRDPTPPAKCAADRHLRTTPPCQSQAGLAARSLYRMLFPGAPDFGAMPYYSPGAPNGPK